MTNYEVSPLKVSPVKLDLFCFQVILAHLPLTLVCLDGLGNLSEKHPVMAQQAVSCLRSPLYLKREM